MSSLDGGFNLWTKPARGGNTKQSSTFETLNGEKEVKARGAAPQLSRPYKKEKRGGEASWATQNTKGNQNAGPPTWVW